MPGSLPILAAVDGSDESDVALREAARLATTTDAPLVIVAVVPPPMAPLGGLVPTGDWFEDIVHDYESVLQRAKATAEGLKVAGCRTVLLRGPVVETILGYLAESPARVIVVGARGRSALSRYFLGSVSEGLVHHAPCSIYVVRPPSATTAPGGARLTSTAG